MGCRVVRLKGVRTKAIHLVVDWESLPSTVPQQQRVFETIGESPRLIEIMNPIGFNRVKRHLRRVVAMHLQGRVGEYSARWNAAVVDRGLILADDGSWRAALVILHEATHADLEHRGFELKPKVVRETPKYGGPSAGRVL